MLGKFDNSVNRARNPDSKVKVRQGNANEDEMMDGWIEYLDAVPALKSLAASNQP